MQTEYDFVWTQPQTLIMPSGVTSPSQPHTSKQDPSRTSFSLWVSLLPNLRHVSIKQNGPLGSCLVFFRPIYTACVHMDMYNDHL